jgi:hypothetical protein
MTGMIHAGHGGNIVKDHRVFYSTEGCLESGGSYQYFMYFRYVIYKIIRSIVFQDIL